MSEMNSCLVKEGEGAGSLVYNKIFFIALRFKDNFDIFYIVV